MCPNVAYPRKIASPIREVASAITGASRPEQVRNNPAASGITLTDDLLTPMMAVGRTDAELATAIGGVGLLVAFYGATPNHRPVLEVEG